MIHVFIGTKAQLIKMAPIMRVLQDRGHDYNFIYNRCGKKTIDYFGNRISFIVCWDNYTYCFFLIHNVI